jgi:hypothetical protein
LFIKLGVVEGDGWVDKKKCLRRGEISGVELFESPMALWLS